MFPRRAALVIALSVLASWPVAAAEAIHMYALSGECRRLALGETDLTGECTDSIMQVTYDSGRVGLYAFTRNDQIYTFSGASDEVVGEELHHELDRVILGRGLDDIGTQAVRGTCVYGNPFAGPAQVTCTAEDGEGLSYEFDFLTDGTPPIDQLAGKTKG